jgi:acetylornithine deacetylase/succinyl-diaminopimelate desuccinylase family protein
MVSLSERLAIVESAHDLEPSAISLLEELIETPSVNPPGEYEAVHDLLVSRYEDYDWDVETVWTPEAVLEELGLPTEYPRPNVLAYATRGEGPTIALNVHLDTVPVDDPSAWDHDPFGAEIDDGRIWGRGANDSKGRIASYTLAVRALEATGLLPDDATVVLAITADEETGGQAGPEYVLESGALDPEYAIVEGNCEAVTRAASGVRHYEVEVSGTTAHAGLNPEDGGNAIVAVGRLVDAIETYNDELATRESDVPQVGSPTCAPGTIEGGAKTNVVPAHCSFTVDQRVPPDFDGDELEAEFERVIESTPLPERTEATITTLLRAASYSAEPDAVHVQALRENAEAIFEQELPIVGIRGFTDGRFFASAGAKTLNFGPGDSRSNPHGIDESVAVDHVRDAGATVAASIVDIARA